MTEPTEADLDHIREAVLEAATRAALERGLNVSLGIVPCLAAALDLARQSKAGEALLASMCADIVAETRRRAAARVGMPAGHA